MRQLLLLVLALFLAMTPPPFSSELIIAKQGLVEGGQVQFTHRIDNFVEEERLIEIDYELFNEEGKLLWNQSVKSNIRNSLIVHKKINSDLEPGKYELKATINWASPPSFQIIEFEILPNNMNKKVDQTPYLLAILSIVVLLLITVYLLYKPNSKALKTKRK